jgi:drug/metabolite transporter (DMT)-like permease
MTVNVSFVIIFSKAAGASPAVMLSITTLSSFTTALAFYLIYHEKLTWKHITGMLSIIVCVVIVAVSKSIKEGSGGFEMASFKKILIPIAFALFECVCMSAGSVLLREAVKRGYSPLHFTIDITGIGGLIYLVGYIYMQSKYHLDSASLFWFMQLAAFDLIVAFVLLNLSLKYGKGGLAMAIVQT